MRGARRSGYAATCSVLRQRIAADGAGTAVRDGRRSRGRRHRDGAAAPRPRVAPAAHPAPIPWRHAAAVLAARVPEIVLFLVSVLAGASVFVALARGL